MGNASRILFKIARFIQLYTILNGSIALKSQIITDLIAPEFRVQQRSYSAI